MGNATLLLFMAIMLSYVYLSASKDPCTTKVTFKRSTGSEMTRIVSVRTSFRPFDWDTSKYGAVVPNEAFKGCDRLNSLVIRIANAQYQKFTIGDSAFEDTPIKSITYVLGSGVINPQVFLGKRSFANCKYIIWNIARQYIQNLAGVYSQYCVNFLTFRIWSSSCQGIKHK